MSAGRDAQGGGGGNGGAATFALSRHAALKSRREGDLLVLPERAIRLGGSGGEILHLFERPSSLDGAVARMRERYPASAELAPALNAFVERMLRLGALVPVASGAASNGTRRVGEGESIATRRGNEIARQSPISLPGHRPDGADENDAAPSQTPLNLIAELTYRCPLQCPYCSNPLDFRERRESLDADAWGRVFEEAAELGVVHLGLTGGEPSTRSDLEEILSHAVRADLYPHLVTAARPLTIARLDELAARGLRSVQVSIQASDASLSDRIAGTKSFEEKLAIARRTVELGLSLTLNCVLHRQNLAQVPELIELAIGLGADRLELANTQFHNWALLNRAALMPSRDQLDTASQVVKASRARAHANGLTLLFVLPDYYAGRPKPCMGGWGRLAMVIDPTGSVLPCHEASELPGLEFWRVPERSLHDGWHAAPGMQAFRGTAWMPEPCQSCPERDRDFGGCRCQAFRLTGDPARVDPACELSPDHGIVAAARSEIASELVPRR